VEEQPVKLHARKPWSGGTVAVEEGKTDDEKTHSFNSHGNTRGTCSFEFQESRSPCRQYGCSVPVGKQNHRNRQSWGGWGKASIFFAPARQPKLTNTIKGQDAIKGFKVGKAPGPISITIRALKHFPISVFSQLVLFNAIFWIQYFRQLGKNARVFHPENRKASGAALVLSTYKSARHDWQAVLKDLTRYLCEVGGVSYYTMSRVGSDPSTALRYSTPVS